MPPPDYVCDTCGAVLPAEWVHQPFDLADDYINFGKPPEEWGTHPHRLYYASDCTGTLKVRL